MQSKHGYGCIFLLGIFSIFLAITLVQRNSFLPSDSVVIVLSPHFDDAALSVGGIIARFKGEKYVVTFFSTPTTTAKSLAEWDALSGFMTSDEARVSRPQENRGATQLLNAHAINAAYTDTQYHARTPAESLEVEKSMAADIMNLISSFPNTSVNVFGPSYFGADVTHPDHASLSRAFAQSISQAKNKNVHFYFYEDVPYVYKRFGMNIHLKDLLSTYYPNLSFRETNEFLTGDEVSRKIESIGLYTSQIRAFDTLKENILSETSTFVLHRCRILFFIQPCEVIYEATPH